MKEDVSTMMREAETVIREFRHLKASSSVPQERRHILELQCRADRVTEQLRQAANLRPVPPSAPSLGELDKLC